MEDPWCLYGGSMMGHGGSVVVHGGSVIGSWQAHVISMERP